jgi:hypothetical protein
MKTQESEVPVMLIEVIDQQDSGYVRDDTAGTPYEERITSPGAIFIPNTGKMSKPIVNSEGAETGRFQNVSIRYIKGCPFIDIAEQEKNNWKPNSIANEDAIVILKGKTMVKREGDVALFDYLEKVFYNVNAPNRPTRAKAFFKVVELDKQTESLNERDFEQAEAVRYVQSLVIKKGEKKYAYKEDKIDNILQVLNLFGGETYPDKINVLTKAAKNSPENFLKIVIKSEDITVTEVAHAIELNVIHFVGNSAEYVKDKKVVASLGTESLSKDKKISKLAELLRTPEYAQAYQDLKVMIELTQEESLK